MSDGENGRFDHGVLLFDQDRRRREIRAGNLRMRGLDVLCAGNVEELRGIWKRQTFKLVLIETSDCPEVLAFTEEVRSTDPRQRLAFFVGKPKYLALLPLTIEDDEAPTISAAAEVVSVEDAFQSLPNRNGFLEASLRMQLARSSRRGATTVRPVKDPWSALKGIADAD